MVVAAATAAALVLTDACTTQSAGSVAPASTGGRYFAATSPFNEVIRPDPVLDVHSAAMIKTATADGVRANLVAYGIPIYAADASTPRYAIRCTYAPAWGRCPFAHRSIPVPARARPQSGSDAALVVVDRSANAVYEFWRAHRSGSGWTTGWGSISSLTGSGWSSSSTGSGASRLAGVIQLAELRAGRIRHALVMQTSDACAKVRRAPATKTDGTSRAAHCIPEGARVQLDPAIDVDALPGLTRAEKVIATALQTYGAYVVDRSSARLSISFERAPDATKTTPGRFYRSLGLRYDYASLDHIPWSRLRVLAKWTGAG